VYQYTFIRVCGVEVRTRTRTCCDNGFVVTTRVFVFVPNHLDLVILVIMMKLLIVTLFVNAVMAFAPISQQTSRQSSTTQLHESFGLGIGEDTYSNQPTLLRGEQEYKQFINKYKEDNMLNRKV
jgi:hypothetical protein